MQISSVIPNDLGLSTTIHAYREGLKTELFVYSYNHRLQLLRDPEDERQWLDGTERTLTEAIQFIISL